VDGKKKNLWADCIVHRRGGFFLALRKAVADGLRGSGLQGWEIFLKGALSLEPGPYSILLTVIPSWPWKPCGAQL